MKNFFKILLFFFILPLLWHFSSRLNLIQRLEENTFRLRYFCRGEIQENQLSKKLNKKILNIFCININDTSFKSIGEAPIPTSYYVKAMYAIQKYAQNPVLVTDVFFDEKQYSTLIDPIKIKNDEQLCRYYFSKLRRPIVGGWFNCNKNVDQTPLKNEYPLPLIKEGFVHFNNIKNPLLPSDKKIGSNAILGLLNTAISTDFDQQVHWIPLYARTQQGIFFNIAIDALHQYLTPNGTVDVYGDDSSFEKYHGQHVILFLDKDIAVAKQIPLKQRQLMEINWFSEWEKSSVKKIPLEVVLQHFNALENETLTPQQQKASTEFFKQFNHSIIFFTNTYTGSPTIKTLIDDEKVPSISAHINTLKTIYWDNYLVHLSEWSNFLIIFVINFFVASLTLYADRFSKCSSTFISLIIIYFLSAFYLFGVYSASIHIVLPIITPLGTVLTLWGFGTIYQLLVERKQRIKLKRVFSNYLSPQLVSAMLDQQNEPQLGGIERNLTAFFSDIQNFSTFSEMLPPEKLVGLMNEYLTEVTNIITEEGGNLDKYIGDAVVAMFGAPFKLENHPLNACISACRIQEKQIFLNKRWAREHPQWPQDIFNMRTRIGLCSGNAVVGNMGSNIRFNFTMMGDTVNIGARCESGAKAYGVYTLVSEDTYKEVINIPNKLVFRFIDRIVVKGRQHPLGVYELMGFKENLKPTAMDCIEIFEKGIHYYLSRNWDKAIECFEQSKNFEPLDPMRDPGVSTNPSITFIKRCEYMKQTPPNPDWNGVFVMKTK